MKILILLFLFIVLTSFGFQKNIDNNAKTILEKCLVFHFNATTYIIGYNHENITKHGNVERYNAMIYKLSDNNFIPASKPFDYVERNNNGINRIVDGMRLDKFDKNFRGGGNSSYFILDDGYILITYNIIDMTGKNNDFNNLLLLKYNKSNWDIIEHYTFKSKQHLLIEQYYYNHESKDRKIIIFTNLDDVEINLNISNGEYDFNIKNGILIK